MPRKTLRSAYRAQWDTLAAWQRQTIELADRLLADLDAIDAADHRERRLTLKTIADMLKAAFPATSAASDAGRALVAQRRDRQPVTAAEYREALTVIEGG